MNHDAVPWQITVSCPEDLLVCLYVRDALGLAHLPEPHIPEATPTVPRSGRIADEAKDDYEAAWARWWQYNLDAHREERPRPLGEPGGLFPELAEAARLREAASGVYREAAAWATARKREHAQVVREGFRVRPTVQDLVSELAPSRPFAVSLTCLPVDADTGWVLAPGHAIVSARLYADRARYIAWLRPRLADWIGDQ